MMYFGSMHWMKQQLPVPTSHLIENLQTLVTGFCGAVFATCLNTPFDVVKSRFQSQVPIISTDIVSGGGGVGGLSPKYTLKYHSTFQTLALICKEEGFLACYKGFSAGAIRMGLGGGVAMTTFELIQMVDQKKSKRGVQL
jgi:hypothetical protein